VLHAFILIMAAHNVKYAFTSHCRYSTTYEFSQPGVRDECVSREADVKETGIGMYKISQTRRIHMF
jgi:hypothetical protein